MADAVKTTTRPHHCLSTPIESEIPAHKHNELSNDRDEEGSHGESVVLDGQGLDDTNATVTAMMHMGDIHASSCRMWIRKLHNITSPSQATYELYATT